jgi:hypothetical protein
MTNSIAVAVAALSEETAGTGIEQKQRKALAQALSEIGNRLAALENVAKKDKS